MGNGTNLGKVRGLGSAKHGADHWTLSRITAIGNLTLMVWLIVSLLTNDLADFTSFTRWLSAPFAAVPMILLVVCALTHVRLGLQVLIEDYVHAEATKLATLLALTFFVYGAGATALFSIAKIAFGVVPHVGQ